MHFATLALSALTLISSVTAHPSAAVGHASGHATVHEKRQIPWRPCSHLTGGVHIIAAPGEGHAKPPYGLLDSLRISIMNAIPGSTNISMPYDHDETNGLKQTGDGTNTLNIWIAQYHQICPKTKIVLIGYSSGAIMGLNSLCGEGPQYAALGTPSPMLDHAVYGRNVIAAVLYGDETRQTHQRYNRGTCQAAGLHPRPNPDCGRWTGRIHSFCDADDPMCCVATGTDKDNHYTYPQKYDRRATDFVLRKLEYFGGA